MKQRVYWIDVCKAFGMFFIYLGHFGSEAGLAHAWVFSFHVPLFFFISGLLENYNRRSFIENLKKKFLTIALPFFFFGILMTVIQVINENTGASVVKNMGILLKGGIRNTCIMAQGLWFLTCLFVIEILFSALKKLKRKPIILGVCLGLFLAAEFLVIPNPTVQPHWYWNLDSAFYYIIYYCVGWLVFEPLEKVLDSKKRSVVWGRRFFFLFCTMYSALLFFGKNILLGMGWNHVFLMETAMLIGPLFTIYMVVVISGYFSQNLFLRQLGENNLYLCGNETLSRLLVQLVLSAAGVQLMITSPLQAYLYSVVLMVLVHKILVPLEKPILSNIQKYVKERSCFK